jgi:hypothetical protein
MNATTAITELPHARRLRASRPRLVGAEILKLRKRRGLVLATLALTVAPMLVAYAVLSILHATNSAKYGPAGGLENLSGSMEVLSQLGAVAAILVGATLGAGDLGSGVFRELVITGRSRLALFAARVPAGLALLFAAVGAGFAVTAIASVVLAGSRDVPSGGLLLGSAAWLALVTGLALVLALGISSAIGSRGTTIGIVLGWQLVAMPLLLQIRVLGSFRDVLPIAATERLEPATLFEGGPTVPISLGAAAIAVVAWIVAPLAVGAWRTCTRDA